MLNHGIMRVSFEVLRECLRLPESTRITDAMVDEIGFATDVVALKLESDDFPGVVGGNKLPEVTAEFTADGDGYPVFVQWKID